jgi:diguanylate cyclase (GGDEF)-like protein
MSGSKPFGSWRVGVPSFIFASLVCAGFVAVGFVLALALWMAGEANRQAGSDAATVIDTVMTGMRRQVARTTREFAYWEEAYFAAIAQDLPRIESTIGSAVRTNDVLSLVQVVGGDGVPLYGHADATNENPGRGLPMHTIELFAAALRAEPIEPEESVTGFVETGGQLYLLSASHMFPNDLRQMKDGPPPILISGTAFLTQRLPETGADLLGVPRLIPVGNPVPGGYDAMALRGPDGVPVASLIWPVPRPGDRLLATALPAIGALSLLLLTALVLTARKTSAMAAAVLAERALARSSARIDELTGLMSRIGLMERVREPEMTARIERGEIAVVHLDLKNFITINDQLGHNAGDKALLVTAERLRAALRPEDQVARPGGDEFVCLLVSPDPDAAAQDFCRRLSGQIANPIKLGDQMRFVRAFIGVSVADPGDSWEDLKLRSDIALSHAKRFNKREPVFFSEDLREAQILQKTIESRLRCGLKAAGAGQSPFRMEFQPIIDVRTGEMRYAEALIRWKDHALGPVAPAAFIPIAEARGLLPDLGAFVLNECCRLLRDAPELRMSVNISPLQLVEEDFPRRVLEITGKAGIDPARLVLEITENTLIEVPETARGRIDTLRANGFRFALDDFGTGYASIGYLRHFPFEIIKIDQSYLEAIEDSARVRALFQTLVTLGQTLDIDVVAEGMETAGQANIVLAAGCYLQQGFHHARPMAFAELIEYHRKTGDSRRNLRQIG